MKHIFPLALLWIAVLAVTACAPAPVEDPAALVVAAPAGPLARAIEGAAGAYTRSTGAAVRVEALSGDDYGPKVSAVLLAGLDRYDLVYLSADDLARWAAYHALQPLTVETDQAALSAWLPAVTVNGQMYGIPTQPDPSGLWYRADLLKAAGLPVPKDWDALQQAAHALNAPPGHYGMAVAGSDLDAVKDFSAVLAGFGGQAVGNDYRVEFDSRTAQRALAFYAGLAGEGAVPGAGRMTRADVLSALREGRAALGIGPFSARADLLDCKASPKVCPSGQAALAWTWLPGLDARRQVGSLGSWAVPIKAGHAAAAQRFAAWLSSEAGARAWAQAGGIPAHPAALKGLAGAEELAQAAEFRLAFPPVSSAGLLWKAGSAALNAAVSGEQPPADALAAAAEQMRTALRQAGVVTNANP